MKIKKFQKYVYDTLETSKRHYVNGIIYAVIVLNMLAIILESMEFLRTAYGVYFYFFELLSIIIFTTEYIARLWACTIDKKYKGRFSGRLRYSVTAFALIDILSILPFYLPFLIVVDLRVMRMLRLLRIFRIFKLGRYSKSIDILTKVFSKKKEDLILTIFVVSILLVISSTIMYYFENSAQPDIFSSIPAAMWWGVATLTTVGYGDVYPITLMGKVIGSFISILGIGVFALPTGILASGLIDEMNSRKNKLQKVCPHCKNDITDIV